MKKKLLSASVALMCLGSFNAQALTYISAKAMVDVQTGEVIQSPLITIDNGVITDVTQNKKPSISKNDQHIDLPELTLMPGLMDMHVHLTSDPTVSRSERLSQSVPRMAIKAAHFSKKTLLAGFTTLRNVGAEGYSVIAVRDGINAGDIVGPRIWAAGPSLGITGGHCDNNRLPPELKYTSTGVADGPWAARVKVRENIKYGANAIKFCATGGVFSKGTKVGVQQYSFEEMKAIVDEAHMRDLPVAAHAHGTSGIKTAIKAGVDSIEHASFLDDEAIALAKKHGTWLSMDIYNTEYTLSFGEQNGVDEENLNKERQVSKKQRDSFNRAVKAGVNMVFGTDAAIYPHGDNAKQFSRMVKFGMSELQAIQAATINSAKLLKMDNKLGQLKSGFAADIIAVKGNPLKNISVLERIPFVMKAGVVYKK
ncbi:amidohydrolase family protein [Pseudoalteromonas sp. 2CM41L]|uniref:Xaa-Pro dipeptidase n=1 Tax=unclassified Pseudoalteromonas TaxID=194690 RepID=UPI0020BD9A42|nr:MULTISPECIES: amidohydrolase family protein [unclassified Pseudoalteromonas]MCK8105498.1 amidohydrolase family protein [Pseudoalteromonas sp. 2CM41L]MCK8117230.1 amidohydrolase family protein [Pseudoalteromonas sp. 2CM37A]